MSARLAAPLHWAPTLVDWRRNAKRRERDPAGINPAARRGNPKVSSPRYRLSRPRQQITAVAPVAPTIARSESLVPESVYGEWCPNRYRPASALQFRETSWGLADREPRGPQSDVPDPVQSPAPFPFCSRITAVLDGKMTKVECLKNDDARMTNNCLGAPDDETRMHHVSHDGVLHARYRRAAGCRALCRP